MSIASIVTGLFKPVASIINKRQERKQLKEQAVAKLTQSAQDDTQAINLNKDEWEALNVSGMQHTWKDEYVTVSVVSILNIIVVGGLATAFGYPQVLSGIGTAIKALGEVGVDIGFLLEATILAGLGLSIWKRA
ncbi:hypothetical protein LCGC14_2426890 [marine sediment metagenome]|uniref:Uncharacterized protein n=1 Tax=marine sediment metagenome TaxID=412755 RepID=A0A0F9BN65_9ZZZZ